jgi:hypothetical protein
MSFALFRRITLSGLAAMVACALTSAQGGAAVPAHEPGGVYVPHFGKGNVKVCVSRARERNKAIMNGDSVARFDNEPPASNLPCR